MPKNFLLVKVDVQAIKITDEDSVARAVLWAGGAPSTTELAVYVPTVDGTLKVAKDEYLVKRVEDGTFTKMTADEFEPNARLI